MTNEMRFQIGETIYTSALLDEVSLKDLLAFNREADEAGLSLTYADIENLAVEVAALKPEEAAKHPQKLVLIAVTIWASRRAAGEKISFGDAIDVPLSKIKWLPVTQDRVGPTKPKPRGTRTASEAAGEPQAEALEQ